MDDPITIKAIDYASSLTKEGYSPAYEVLAENTEESLFKSGKVSMIIQGSWMVTDLMSNDYVKENDMVDLAEAISLALSKEDRNILKAREIVSTIVGRYKN